MARKKRKPQVDLKDEYERCANLARQRSELFGVHELEQVLPREKNHAFVREVGIWLWEQELLQMAFACFLRSLAIKPEADTYFNLAVCLDDLENNVEGEHDIFGHDRGMYANGAQRAMLGFYELAGAAEIEECEGMLRMNGKGHLVRGENGENHEDMGKGE